jgi:hypothetical protein
LPGPDYPLKQRHAHKNVIHVVICNNSLFWDSTIKGIRQFIFTD